MTSQLIDRFGREHSYLRISVTDRCNLRCQYCMPAEGIQWKQKTELLSFEEIIRLARLFVDLGVRKIRLTGGEPLVRKNLPDLIEQLAMIPLVNVLAMTTNALLLKGNCALLKRNGITALNISLDTLKRDRFMEITRRDAFQAVMEGIEEACATAFASIKVNCVLMSAINSDEILDFVEFGAQRDINVRFIEYMPFKDNNWQEKDVLPYADAFDIVSSRYRLIPRHNEKSAVAKDFAIDGHKGTVSFITSMSDSFCAACDRLRLTADGALKSCLFYNPEVSLRDAMREGASNHELKQIILDAVMLKPEAHPPMEELASVENRAMIEIGG